jgi:hypothetical protein
MTNARLRYLSALAVGVIILSLLAPGLVDAQKD